MTIIVIAFLCLVVAVALRDLLLSRKISSEIRESDAAFKRVLGSLDATSSAINAACEILASRAAKDHGTHVVAAARRQDMVIIHGIPRPYTRLTIESGVRFRTTAKYGNSIITQMMEQPDLFLSQQVPFGVDTEAALHGLNVALDMYRAALPASQELIGTMPPFAGARR